MGFVDVQGVKLHYEDKGSGKVILFIHGNTGSWRWWQKTLDLLPPGFRGIAVDLRGAGESDKPGTGYDIPQYGEDLYGLVRKLGLSDIHLVGHSLGGAVALQIALDHPEVLRSLTMVNPAPAEGMPIPEDNFPMLAAVASNRDFMRPALASMMPTAPQDEYFEQLLNDAMTAGPTLVPNARSLTRLNLTDRLGDLKIPTMILFGLKDIIVSLDAVRRTQSGIKDAHLEVWPDCGHSPIIEKPVEFTGLLTEFIAKA